MTAGAGALADDYHHARTNDFYLTTVIISPQTDHFKGASQQQDQCLTAGTVDRDAAGITLRGAKMLATGDERHALSSAIPMDSKGLEIPSRTSCDAGAASVFDQQHGMVYAGATFISRGHSFRTYDRNAATGLLDQVPSGYTLADELAPPRAAA